MCSFVSGEWDFYCNFCCSLVLLFSVKDNLFKFIDMQKVYYGPDVLACALRIVHTACFCALSAVSN